MRLFLPPFYGSKHSLYLSVSVYDTMTFGPTGFGLSRQPIELCAIGPLAFFTCFLLFDSVTGVVSIVS